MAMRTMRVAWYSDEDEEQWHGELRSVAATAPPDSQVRFTTYLIHKAFPPTRAGRPRGVEHCIGVRQRAAAQPARDRHVDADCCTVSDGRLDADDLANSCAT